MAEYQLTDFQYVDKDGNVFKDQNGNTWGTAVFQGVGEPVKWVVKDPTKITVGQNYSGEIKEMTSKQGKPYQRFFRDRPQQQSFGGSKSYSRDDSAIRAQWAIGQAVGVFPGIDKNAPDSQQDRLNYISAVENLAKEFYAMVDRVKSVTDTTNPGHTTRASNEPITGQDEVHDYDPRDTDIINLNDIPF